MESIQCTEYKFHTGEIDNYAYIFPSTVQERRKFAKPLKFPSHKINYADKVRSILFHTLSQQ